MPPLPVDPAVLLAAIVTSSDDAIVSKNLDGIITSWNRAAERMFGYTSDEAVGQSIRLIIPKERYAEEDETLRKIRSGEGVTRFETVRHRKDGTLIDVSLTVSPVRGGRPDRRRVEDRPRHHRAPAQRGGARRGARGAGRPAAAAHGARGRVELDPRIAARRGRAAGDNPPGERARAGGRLRGLAAR